MNSTETKPTLADLAYAADEAARAYDIAQRKASQLNSRQTGAAAIKAYKAKVRAQAAFDVATNAEDARMADVIAKAAQS